MNQYVPLTAGQAAAWASLSQYPDKSVAQLAGFHRIDAALDVGRFVRAADPIVSESEIFRLRIRDTPEGPRQFLAPRGAWTLPVHDLSAEADPEAAARRMMENDGSRPWRSADEAPGAAALFRLGRESFLFYLRGHELATDQEGLRDLALRVLKVYQGQSPLPGQPLPVAAEDEARYLAGPDRAVDEAYWRDLFLNRSEAVTLSGRLPSAAACLPSVGCSLDLGPENSARFREAAAAENAAPLDLLLTYLAVYLHRFTGESDLVIATPVRQGPRSQELPLRWLLAPDQTVRQVLAKTVEHRLEAVRHRAFPASTRAGYGLLAAVATEPAPDFGGRPAAWVQTAWGPVFDFALVLAADPSTGTFRLDLQGNSAHHTVAGLELHARRLADLMARPWAALADAPVSQINLLTDRERQVVLHDWNNNRRTFPLDLCVHELFERQAGKTPDAVALAFEGTTLTYAELNARANRMARHLRSFGVGPDRRAAICVERGIDMILGLLAVLKAGGAYVPLDSHFPADRLDYMLADSGAVVLLSEPATEVPLARLSNQTPRINLGDPSAPWASYPDTNLPRAESSASPENLVYVIYTSGSTGLPKGVGISGLNLLNYSQFIVGTLPQRPHLKFASVSTIAADLGNTVVFPCLISGGELHVISSQTATKASAYEKYMAEHQIDVLKITPTHFQALFEAAKVEALIPRTALVFGGERLTSDLVDSIAAMRPGCLIYNHYGPTECTVGSIMHLVTPDRDRAVSIPLGFPIANARIYVLDGADQPVPVGATGEIHIGGAGVARGYLNRDEETAKRFKPDPFAGTPGERMYKTGDLGRWLPNGMIEFLGRNDFQVKLRGFRIELGEIEAALARHPQVAEAAILVKEDEGSKRLVAFYTAEQSVPVDELKTHLLATLPEYMVPNLFHRLEGMPLTPNGKLDRHRLAELAHSLSAVVRPDPVSRTSDGDLLHQLKTMLMVDAIDPALSFIDHGGDSLSYIRATMVVEKHLGWLPPDWEKRPFRELLALKPRKPGRFSLSSVGTPVVARAVSILNVLVAHFGLPNFVGSNTALFLIAGISLGRYQLPSILKRGRTASLWKTILMIALPATLLNLFEMTRSPGGIDLSWLLMLNSYAGTGHVSGFWFINVLLQIYAVLALVLAVPAVRGRLEGRIFEVSFGAAAVGLAFSAVEFFLQAGDPIRTPAQEVWLVFLGIAMAHADTTPKKLLVAGMVLFSALDEFAGTYVALFPLAVAWLILVVPRISLPRPLAWAVNSIAGASLYIYLTHWYFQRLLFRIGFLDDAWVWIIGAAVGGVIVGKLWEAGFNPLFAVLAGRFRKGTGSPAAVMDEAER